MQHKIHKKHLKEGSIIPIWLSWNNQKSYRGDAILLYRDINSEIPEDQKEYEFIEIGSENKKRKKEKVSVIYSHQTWVVKFITGTQIGFTTKVKIAYYKKTMYGRE